MANEPEHDPSSSHPAAAADEREMFDEINQLVGQMATALEMSEEDVIHALEGGHVSIEMTKDDKGKFIAIRHKDKVAHVYQGAIYRPDDSPSDKPVEH